MKTNRTVTRKISSLILTMEAIVAPMGCERKNPTMPPSGNTSQTYFYDAKNDIHGFGNLEQIQNRDSPVFFHEIYKTGEGNYFIGVLGAGLYAIDAKNGQLLNTFAHELTKTHNGLRVKIGTSEYNVSPPSSFSDFDTDRIDEKDDWVYEEFEERAGGIYVRDWK